jgi:transcriptional regulator with XRE-family HTH domain
VTPDQFQSWRVGLGLTQAGAARLLGRSRTQIQSYESGRAPVPRVVELACAALKR